jgi:drug/metabolite transporter (DMT)-like permease
MRAQVRHFRPVAFVLLWSTGYIAAPIALRDAQPFTLLFLRFVLAALGLGAIALVLRAPWPRQPREIAHIMAAGLLSQATQFGGLYAGMKAGVPGAIAALIAGTMPILTALGATSFLGERLVLGQWLGLLLGFGGVALVVEPQLGGTHPALRAGFGFVLVGLGGLTAGTLYQKRFCAHMDARTGGFLQLLVGAAVMFVLARSTETMHVTLTPSFAGALAYIVIANSIVAAILLLGMIRDGEVNRVASLFYLIPPVSALMAALALHERFAPLAVLGFAVAAVGVALATRLSVAEPGEPSLETELAIVSAGCENPSSAV